jgi:hypothetical protein
MFAVNIANLPFNYKNRTHKETKSRKELGREKYFLDNKMKTAHVLL